MAWPDPLIHIVDDDPVFTKFIESHVRSNGFNNIKTFQSGEAFLEAIKENPDIVLLDFSLQGINGKDVLKEIKKNKPRIKVAVITVINDRELEGECLKLGATDYLVKEESRMDAVKTRVIDILQETKRNKFRKLVGVGVLTVVFIAVIYFILTMPQ
jgi:DNA-binding response OmpR family regulator